MEIKKFLLVLVMLFGVADFQFSTFQVRFSCVQSVDAKRKKTVKKVPQRTLLAPADARRLSYYYQEGIKQKLAGNMSEAFDLFQHCLAIDPQDPDALFETAYLHFYMGQDSLGTDLFRRVVELDGRNPRYVQSLAAAYLARNEYERAIPVLERLSELQTRREDVLQQLVELYKSTGKTDEAIRVLDRIEVLEGRSLNTALQKYALYTDKGDQTRAFGVLEDMERESPYDLRIPIIIGKQYLETRQPERALECFRRVESVDPENMELRMAMMEYYEQTGAHDRRIALRDSLLYAPDTPDDLRARMASLLLYDMKNSPRDSILWQLDSLVRLSPSALMHSLRVTYMMGARVGQDTIASAMRDLLVVAPDNENALTRLLVYYLDKKDMEQVAEICRMGINADPDGLTYYFYLAVALQQMKQNQQAIETLQSGLRQACDDTAESANSEYISDLYSILGDLYHEEGRVEDAFAAYDSCLVYKDDNAMCLNNYAYFLSLRNERLADAERMAYRATKIEPLNKTYLDTYAWVLFQQENYMMAKFYIDRVISPSATDETLLKDDEVHADVLEHAGDIYFRNDKVEEAVRYWQLADQKNEEPNDSLKAKIKNKKL